MSSNLPARIPKTPLITPANPPMRVPGHGHGMLRVGGTNKGGPGRPPSAVRAAMRTALDERIPILEEIADDPEAAPKDRLRALELLARFGLTSDENSLESERVAHVVRFDFIPPSQDG